MPPTYVSDDFVVCNSLTADFDRKCDDLLAAQLDKNDYDWLVTPPGTPLTNPLKHNSAVDGCDVPSREPFIFAPSPASIKISQFLSTQVESNSRKQDATRVSEFLSRKGPHGVSNSNSFRANLLFSANEGASLVYKKTPFTPSRPASPNGASISSAQTLKPKIPLVKTKPSSTTVSHPTTQTSRNMVTTASQTGNFSASTPARKTGLLSPAATPSKSQSRLHPQNHPLSLGLSGSSSGSKASSQASKSAPGSRVSSPWENSQRPVASSRSQSNSASSLQSNLVTPPISMISRSSSVGTSNKSHVITATRKALFSSVNQLEISLDTTKRTSSTNLSRGMKGGDNLSESKQLICSADSSGISRSTLQVKPSAEIHMSASFGLGKKALQRSFDTAMHNLKICQGVSNGHSSPVRRKHDHSYHSSSMNAEARISWNSSFRGPDRFTNAVSSLTTSGGHISDVQLEDFKCPLDFKASQADQTSSMLFVKGDYTDNWLKTTEYKRESPDGVDFFEGLGKFGSWESPLVCPHGGAVTCDLCNVKMRLQMLNEKSKARFEASSRVLSEA